MSKKRLPSNGKSRNIADERVPGDIRDILVREEDFLNVIRGRHSNFLSAGLYIEGAADNFPVLTRPLLALILSETEQLEELLDSYGARYNTKWLVFREIIAMARIVSRISYTVLHVQHSLPRYRLRRISRDIFADTDRAASYLSESLTLVMKQLMRQARTLGLQSHVEIYPDEYYSETLPTGQLPRDRHVRHVDGAEQTLLMVATESLGLTARGSFLHKCDVSNPACYPSYVPDPISEESLREMEYHFHNLQSLYDTYLLGTDLENADVDLRTLRGHVSIIFHLLQAGTEAVHLYERHILLPPQNFSITTQCELNIEQLLGFLIGYCVAYASSYLDGMRSLCQEILNKYMEIATIEVPVPPYRGFHVRPATLVAKIVHHYGSNVTMELAGHKYDAGNTLDLFRANESVNAEKRRRIAEKVNQLPESKMVEAGPEAFIRAVRRAILSLAERNEIVIYEHPLPIQAYSSQNHGRQNTRDFIVEAVKRLLALGKIDLESRMQVRFIGDKRVLRDIKLLAENGYGEDRFGNNIPLPSELSYLREER